MLRGEFRFVGRRHRLVSATSHLLPLVRTHEDDVELRELCREYAASHEKKLQSVIQGVLCTHCSTFCSVR